MGAAKNNATEKTTKIPNITKNLIQVGERVKVKALDDEAKERLDTEDYYYLKKFENKTGTVCEKNKSQVGKYAYKVEFSEHEFGYFYRKDLLIVDED